MFNLSGKSCTLCLALAVFSVAGYGESIEESIDEALHYYKDGEYKGAVDSLNYAAQLIQQKRGAELESYLPAPLSGWRTQETSSQTMGAAMFGGITAERQYSKGSSSITVEIITDSPVMQSMMMMFSNPMFATSDGGKLEKIGRQKAIVKFDPKRQEGDIKIVVAHQFLVSIEGQNVSEEDLKSYAQAVDYKKLQSLP